MKPSCAILARIAAAVLLLATAMPLQAQGACETLTFTTADDFSNEFWVNLNTLNDSGLTVDQVRVNKKPQPLPYIWVAISGVIFDSNVQRTGTLVRINTETGDILGEYRTAPKPASAPSTYSLSPSRTTVSLTGSVFAGNRLGVPGSVVEMGLVVGGTRGIKVGGSFVPDPNGEYIRGPYTYNTCVDCDEDELIRTSRTLGNILDWPDISDGTGGDNGGPALVEDADDECILVFQRLNGYYIKHVSVDDNNDCWVGGVDANRSFDRIAGETGEILESIFNGLGSGFDGGYGGLIDANGVLWSATPYDGSPFLRYNTVDGTFTMPNSNANYGIGLDISDNIWITQWYEGKVDKFEPSGTHQVGFPRDSGGENHDRGVVVTASDNNVWVANSGFGPDNDRPGTTVSRLDNNGNIREVIDLADFDGQLGIDCREPTGVTVDAAGQVWVACRNSHSVVRIAPSANPTVTPSQPNLKVPLGNDAWPYNYSDMTGMVGLLAHKNGVWTLRHDSGAQGAFWQRVTWNSEHCMSPDPEEPAGTFIRVEIRSAESETGLTRAAWREVTSGEALVPRAVGQFLELRAILNGKGYEADFATPVLCDLEVDMDCGHRIFVDESAVGGRNDGTSWADAFLDLQDGRAVAAATAATGGEVEIWVAQGTYIPSPNGDTGASFQLASNVAIYGGFGGWETDRSERNPGNNPTILSGDLDGNDGPNFAGYDENSGNVVTATDCDATAILDGFIVRAANGQGMNNGPGSSATLNDCTFTANTGNGFYSHDDSDPTLSRCTFDGNLDSGMANFILGSDPFLVNCVFMGNSAGYGAGINNFEGHVTLVNCSLSANSASGSGGGVYNYSGQATLANCILWDNSDSGGQNQSAQLYNEGGMFAVSYCCVEGWSSGGTGNTAEDPLLIDPNSNLRLRPGSPSIDTGNTAAVPVGGDHRPRRQSAHPPRHRQPGSVRGL